MALPFKIKSNFNFTYLTPNLHYSLGYCLRFVMVVVEPDVFLLELFAQQCDVDDVYYHDVVAMDVNEQDVDKVRVCAVFVMVARGHDKVVELAPSKVGQLDEPCLKGDGGCNASKCIQQEVAEWVEEQDLNTQGLQRLYCACYVMNRSLIPFGVDHEQILLLLIVQIHYDLPK